MVKAKRKEGFQMWSRIFVLTVFSLVLGLIFITSAEAAFNLANDPRLYQYSKYSPKKHFRTSLQIKVTEDKRPEQEKVKHEEAPYYVYDALWSDFVDNIVAEVLAREFANAKMFDAVDLRDESSRYLLVIELHSFAGRIEAPSGFRSVYHFFGIVDLQVKLISRKRGKVLFTKRYKERSKSMLSQFRAWNKYGYGAKELGRALQIVAVRVMKDVETAMAGGRVDQY